MTTIPADTSPIGRELLDDPAADPRLVAESLRNIARSNWMFGGVAAARFGVLRLLDRARVTTATLLDVGTGLGDVPTALAASLSRRGVRLAVTGVELNPTAARLAALLGLTTVRADGLRLPFRDRSVDVVLLSQVAHHLTAAAVARLAREATRVARLGVVLADLKRSRLAQLGFGVASRLLRFDDATTADGVTSLRRGFRIAELQTLLATAGIEAECEGRLGSRIVATWWAR
jgi:SAM-dependent methyltransferase